MKTVTIEGLLRSETGKKAASRVRSEEMVPGVIYGGDTTVNFKAPATAFKTLVYTPDFQIAEIKLDGKSYRTIIKDTQFHKVTDALTHVDLLELVESKKVIASIPLKYTGQAVGVKAGGKLELKMKTVKVKCFPKDLVSQIEVPIDTLELNMNLRVSDIVATNMEIMNSPRIPIASVVMTRQLRQEETAAAKAGKK
jgi:large subunit ribosomal protein L25